MGYSKDENIRPNNCESSMASKLKVMDKELRTNNKANELQSKICRVRHTKTLSENIEKVLEFDKECEQNGHKVGSRYSAMTTLHCLCQFAGEKPFAEFTKSDVIDFLDASKHRRFEDRRYRARTMNVERKLANCTMNLVKLRVKRFFQWFYGMEKGQYPECVRWINLKTIMGDRKITPEDLPTHEEVKRMIECTENPRDRALISMLAESGARVGEVSVIRLKDITWNDRGFILTLRGKTGQRQIPLCACVADVKNWINNFHPFKGNPEAPLFTSFASSITPKTNLKVFSIAQIVKRIAIRAYVEERIHMHPHKFRHLRASQLAELGWNEPMLRQFFGWSKSSKMPAIYIHMSPSAMNSRYYRMYGKANLEEDKPKNLEEPRVCGECGVQNPHGYRFCFRCNTVLDKERQQLVNDQREVKNALNLIAKNPDLARKFSTLLDDVLERQKRALVA